VHTVGRVYALDEAYVDEKLEIKKSDDDKVSEPDIDKESMLKESFGQIDTRYRMHSIRAVKTGFGCATNKRELQRASARSATWDMMPKKVETTVRYQLAEHPLSRTN
jgi:hypothetical protein